MLQTHYSVKRTVRQPRKNIVSKMIAVLAVSEQMWLPFDVTNAPHVHTFAKVSGFKVKTRTTYKGGIRGIRIVRIA